MEFTAFGNTRVFVPRQSVLLIQPSDEKRTAIVLNNGTSVYVLASFDRVSTLFCMKEEWR